MDSSNIVEAYNKLSVDIFDAAGKLAVGAFFSLNSWNDEDIVRYLALVKPGIDGLKLKAAQLTVAYYQEMAKVDNQRFETVTVTSAAITTEALRGVPFEDVYARPFVQARYALSQNKTLTEALKIGADRAQSIATTEMQLARRGYGFGVRNKNQNIVGYIRTLTGAESCAICYTASTQRYRRGDLLPIHPGCDCGEQPIYGDSDPGRLINEQLNDSVHEALGTRFPAADLPPGIDPAEIASSDVMVTMHGELGPLLSIRKK